MVLQISGIFIVAFALSWYFYGFRHKSIGYKRYVLLGLRFLSLFATGVLLLNPSVEKKKVITIKPRLLVAVDNSASIHYQKNQEEVKRVVSHLKKSQLSDKFDVSYFTFGETVNVLDTLKFSEKNTNLSLPLEHFSSIYSEEGAAPVILITDGNQTEGTQVGYESYQSAVYPFVVGDTTTVEDIYISQVNINKYAYAGNRFPVELFINYEGNKNVTSQVTISSKGKIFFKKNISLSSQNKVAPITTYLTAKGKGQKFYTVSVTPIKSEQNKRNNAKSFSINVIDETAEILLLSSLRHPDLGMLKRVIERDGKRKVTIQLPPFTNVNLAKYKSVILYQPKGEFAGVFNQLKTTEKSYFIVTGTHTDWNFLNNIQPYFKKQYTTQKEVYLPVYNENYTTFILKDIGISNFPPIEDFFGEVTFSVPYQSLMFSKIGNVTLSQPLLANFENGKQRVALLLGENSWRWRLKSFAKQQSFDEFDKTIMNMIQYLSSDTSKKQLEVTVKPIYYSNEPIEITALYSDKNFQFDNRASLSLKLTNSKGFYQKTPFSLGDYSYKVVLQDLPSGVYNYEISVEGSTLKSKGVFKVLALNLEEKFTGARSKDLRILSQHTGGKVFFQRQEQQLVSALVTNNKFKNKITEKVEETPLIDWKWLLGLIVLLLSFEWFLRKWMGLV